MEFSRTLTVARVIAIFAAIGVCLALVFLFVNSEPGSPRPSWTARRMLAAMAVIGYGMVAAGLVMSSYSVGRLLAKRFASWWPLVLSLIAFCGLAIRDVQWMWARCFSLTGMEWAEHAAAPACGALLGFIAAFAAMPLNPLGERAAVLRMAARHREQYHTAMLNPDEAAFKRAYGVAVPDYLKQFYWLGECLLDCPPVSLDLQYVEPMDAENVSDGSRYGWKFYCFARDGDGYAMLVPVGPVECPTIHMDWQVDPRPADVEDTGEPFSNVIQEFQKG